jgi:hypothetical protein
MSPPDSFQDSNGQGLFSSGDGSTFDEAVIVNTASPKAGIDAEYEFVSAQCGIRGKDWTLKLQRQEWHESVPYDILTIRRSDGSTGDFYFDISRFFNKSNSPNTNSAI